MALPLSAHITHLFDQNHAESQHVSPSPTSQYRSVPYTQPHSLSSEHHGATEAFPTYTENGHASYLGIGLPVGQEPQLNFAMTKPVELQLPTAEELAALEFTYPEDSDEDGDVDAKRFEDVGAEGVEEHYTEGGEDEDAEGVEDDDVLLREDGNAAGGTDSDQDVHSQTGDQQSVQAQPTQQPQPVPRSQPKLYIRFSTKKQQAKEAAVAKRRDSKAPTIERKRLNATPIDGLTKEHGAGSPSKQSKFEGGSIELKTSSSPTPLTKGQKRQASPVENLTNEHGDRRPQKKAKIQAEYGKPTNSPVTKLEPVKAPEQKQKARTGDLTSLTQKQKHVVFSPLPPPTPTSPPPHRFSIQIPDDIITLYETLKGRSLQMLPEQFDREGKIMPWTGRQLTLLYIHSYIQDNILLCDPIADVWIRAFQERNRSDTLPEMWHPNKSHVERCLKVVGGHMPGYHRAGLPDVPKWQQKLPLPTLSSDVTDFDPALLGQLYHHTAEGNGARMLWADALALCGTRAEDWFMACKKKGIENHPDLVNNVMCTTLRSYRRRLTLKIEETEKGSWCRRYHLHSKWDMECHRPMGEDVENAGQGAQAGASAHTTGNTGIHDVQDDFDAAMLQGFNNEFESAGNNDLHVPPGHIPQSSVANVDGEDDGASSEED